MSVDDPVPENAIDQIRRGPSLRRWPKKVTIIDVAREAKVSIKTVSRVLNRENHVTKEKRELVQRVIDALGYVPSVGARAMPGGRFYTIGILLERIRSNYLLDIELAVMRQCRESGYHVIVEEIPAMVQTTLPTMRKLVASLPIDGAILLPPASDDAVLLDALEAEHVTFTRMAPSADVSRSFAVTMDDEGATRAMVRLLVNLGHRRIGFIAGNVGHGSAHRRLNAFRAAIDDSPVKSEDVIIRQGDFSFDAGLEQGGAMLDGSRTPTAIFASNDVMAAGVMAAAGSRGLVVPHDLTVCGFDASELSRYLWPPLTTIKQPLAAMAALATQQMLAPAEVERVASFPFELLIRGSSAAPRR